MINSKPSNEKESTVFDDKNNFKLKLYHIEKYRNVNCLKVISYECVLIYLDIEM